MSAMPEGLSDQADMVDDDEERALIACFEALSFAPYVFRGVEASRRIVAYGSGYGARTRSSAKVEPIPEWLEPLRARAAMFAGEPVGSLWQALVTAYPPGAGIGWHRDRPVYDKPYGGVRHGRRRREAGIAFADRGGSRPGWQACSCRGSRMPLHAGCAAAAGDRAGPGD